MSFLSSLFRSRDKPLKDRTSGSAYTFFMGGSTAGKNVNERSAMQMTAVYAAPIAGVLGYSAEDTALAIGLMANAGIKSTQAGTALRTIMTSLNGEIKLSGERLGEVVIETSNADGTMRPFADIIMDCREAFSKLSESEKASTAEALVGKNAMSGFLAIMNAAEGDLDKLSSAIDTCDGSSKRMADTMQDNLNGQVTILKSALQELAIQIGDALMPTIRNIVSKVQEFVVKLQQMDDGTRNMILRLAAFAAAIGPVLLILGKLTSGVGSSLRSISSLGKGVLTFVNQAKLGVGAGGKLVSAIGAIGPVGLGVVAAIAVLVAAFVTLWKNNEEFRNKVTAIWDGIKAKFEAFGQAITDRLNSLGSDFENITEVLSAVWGKFCAVLAPVFEVAFALVSSILGTVLDVLVGLFDVFAGIFSGNWETAWNGVKEVFSAIWNGIVDFFGVIWERIGSTVMGALSAIGAAISAAWNGISTSISSVMEGISQFLSTAWNAIKALIAPIVEGIKADVQGTSSQYYERKNYKLKFKNGFVDHAGKQIDAYSMNDDAIATDVFTFKADVASSEGANNVELVRLYNEACPYRTPAQKRNSCRSITSDFASWACGNQL